jgi:Domain of unknown function (DUF4129)
VRVWRSVRGVIAASAGSSWCLSAPWQSSAFAAAPASGPDGVDPGRAARDVLLAQDFWWKRIEPRPVSTSWFQSILAAVLEFLGRVLRSIWDVIVRIFRFLFGMFGGVSSGGGTLAIWMIVLALLAWSIWKLYPVVKRWLGTSRSLPGTREAVAWEPLAEASDLFEQAGRSFREGQYAEAIRLALLALIARLEKQGRLRYDTTRTNREYQRELRQTPELAACFGQLARIYERVWYGRMSAGRAEAEQAIRLCGSALDGEGLAAE